MKQGTTSIPSGTGSYSFSTTAPGSSSGDVSFTIENTGSLDLTLSSVSLSSGDTGQFTLTDNTTSPVTPTNSTSFDISFDPTAEGSYSATVSIDNNDADENPYTFTINGTSSATPVPEINIKVGDTSIPNGGSYDMGTIINGGTASPITFTVENLGTGQLTLNGSPLVQLGGANASEFTVSTTGLSSTIDAGLSDTFTIQPTPNSVGSKTTCVLIRNDDADEDQYMFTLTYESIVNTGLTGIQLEGRYDNMFPDNARGVYVSGNYAYVADSTSGLRIIDISTPASPSEVGFYDTPGYALGVYVMGNYAYVADRDSGLRIIDISTPASPSEVGFYDTPGYAVGVYVSGNYAYVADGNTSGLRIIDVSNPASPTEILYYDDDTLIGYSVSVFVDGSYVYVAHERAGLLILSTY